MNTTKIIAIIFGLFAFAIKCDLVFYAQTYFQSAWTDVLYSLDVQPKHLMLVGKLGFYTKFIITNITSNQYYYVQSSYGPSNSSAQIRSFPTNQAIQSGSFMDFYQKTVNLYKKGFSVGICVYSVPSSNTKILQSCFGRFPNETLILTIQNLNTNASYYKITGYQLSNTIFGMNISLSTYNKFDRMLHKNGTIYILFQSAIFIYSINGSILSLRKNLVIPNTTVIYSDISANTTYFAYSVNSSINVLQTANYTSVWAFNLSQNIIGICMVDFYIFATSLTSLYQLDYEAKQTINSLNLGSSAYYLVYYFQITQHLILFPIYPQTTSVFTLYSYTFSYKNCTAGVCTCAQTYGIQSKKSQSYKNYNLTSAPNNTTPTAPPIQNNQSIAIGNSTSMMTQTFDTPKDDTYITPPEKPFILKYNTPAVIAASDLLGKTMAFTSIKIAPSFLLPFAGFLDDLWYYQYHRNKYPQSFKFFIQKIDIINELRLNCWFFDSIQLLSDSFVCNASNSFMYQYLNFTNEDPYNVYFLNSAQDTYKNNLVMNVLLLVSLKCLHLFFVMVEKKMSSKRPILRFVVSTLKYNSRWWCLLIACLEINMLKLTFNCFVQLLLPSSFQFLDKINLLFTFATLWMLLSYCLCFYPLVYHFVRDHGARILLNRSSFMASSFFFECFSIVFRNFARSFIHSYFIENYSIQISLLTVIDAFFLLFVIKMFRFFKYQIVGIVCILYLFVFMIFDLYFTLMINSQIDFIVNSDKQQVSLIITLILVSSNVLICLTILFVTLWILVMNIFVKKKIQKDFEYFQEETPTNIIKGKFMIRNQDALRFQKLICIRNKTVKINVRINQQGQNNIEQKLQKIQNSNFDQRFQDRLKQKNNHIRKLQKKLNQNNLEVKYKIKQNNQNSGKFKIQILKCRNQEKTEINETQNSFLQQRNEQQVSNNRKNNNKSVKCVKNQQSRKSNKCQQSFSKGKTEIIKPE